MFNTLYRCPRTVARHENGPLHESRRCGVRSPCNHPQPETTAGIGLNPGYAVSLFLGNGVVNKTEQHVNHSSSMTYRHTGVTRPAHSRLNHMIYLRANVQCGCSKSNSGFRMPSPA
jgi:hypothetical protein